NLDHYRLSADYRHGLHLVSLPTAWVSGFGGSSPLRVGAGAAWVAEAPGATAGFLEFKGTGLSHVERALKDCEQQMAELGARLLGKSDQGLAGEAGLAGCTAAVGKSLSRVLELAHAWLGADWFPVQSQVGIQFGDVTGTPIKGSDLTAIVDAWKSGA